MKVVLAGQFVRKLRGGSQSELLRCVDGKYYVVKFVGNPQQTRILVNEYLASKLAAQIGLPVADVVVVGVDRMLIKQNPGMYFEYLDHRVPVSPGHHLGIRYVIPPNEGHVFDFISPEVLRHRVANKMAFAGMLAFDIWTGNRDARQAVYWKRTDESELKACFIDQGFCFGGTRWKFSDDLSTFTASTQHQAAYESMRSWEDLEPYLSSIERMSLSNIQEIAQQVPKSWFRDWRSLNEMLLALHRRRLQVRDQLERFLTGPGATIFCNWRGDRVPHSTLAPLARRSEQTHAVVAMHYKEPSPIEHSGTLDRIRLCVGQCV